MYFIKGEQQTDEGSGTEVLIKNKTLLQGLAPCSSVLWY